MPGGLCDRRIAAKIKGKIYKTAVRPEMMYGLENVAIVRYKADLSQELLFI